ncbi:ABC transporter permease [Novispirillum itersonii]|uniref:Polar amino acid transport system permease protein n=1 Tax=Novispirillum itersonii TaxID=189 RepID=A0A7W9ZJ95_NOVIT|nr:ABC transporter permease [Novispirillum itersonii]MBB6212195.1 polar amino acid transport system permease protein [Novispirillum itersonii]
MDFELIAEAWPDLLKGAGLTLQLLFLPLAVATVLSIPLAIARSSHRFWVRIGPAAYTFVFRGTPLLVQIFLIYYGIGQFESLREGFLWENILSNAYWCAMIAFTLNNLAYITELMRGGIQTVPHGEVEAARAYGMSGFQTYRLVILPRMWRTILPAYSNEVVFSLKATSLASVVTVLDLTGQAKVYYSQYYEPYDFFIAAGFLYLIMVFVITRVLKGIEWLLGADRRPVKHRGETPAAADVADPATGPAGPA